MGKHLLVLRDLLLSLFQPDELQMFVHLRVDATLVHCLPVGSCSAEVLAYRAAVALEQRGHLGPRIFELLVEERPLREADIQNVRLLFDDREESVNVVRQEAHALLLRQMADRLRVALDSFRAGDHSDETGYAIEKCLRTVETMLTGKNRPYCAYAGAYFDHSVMERAAHASIYAQVCAELVLGAGSL